MLNVKLLIYTTSRTDWFSADFPFIRATVNQAIGSKLTTMEVERITLPKNVPTYTETDGDVKVEWAWFKEQFTALARARGYNAVCWHLTKREARKIGLKGYNGLYNHDPDDVFEFYIICDKGQKAEQYPYSKFAHLVIHELGHGFERWLYGRAKHLVHHFDYELRRVHDVYQEFDFTSWNRLKLLGELLTNLIPLLSEQVRRLSMKNPLHDVALDALGMDASPHDLAPDELGCAETVSSLIQKALPDFPIMTGTWTLFDTLENHPRFEKVEGMPEAGDIIISPTVPGRPFPGHAGIFASHWDIMSNDSRDGLFRQNFTLKSWRNYYATRGGYPIHIYRFKL